MDELNSTKNHTSVFDISTPQELEKAIRNAGDSLIIVDFWAPWCGPCKSLGPLLEKFTQKYAPYLTLLKINVDENQQLAMHFRVQSIPAVKFVKAGQLVDDFVGAQPEKTIEEKIKKHLPEEATAIDPKEEAEASVKAGEWQRARSLLEKILAQDPSDTASQLNLARCCLALHDVENARKTLDTIKSPSAIEERDSLREMADMLAACKTKGSAAENAARAQSDPHDLDAIYNWACALATESQYNAACEALLNIIQQNPKYKDGAARKLLLLLFTLMGNTTPDVKEYRSRLAQALYI